MGRVVWLDNRAYGRRFFDNKGRVDTFCRHSVDQRNMGVSIDLQIIEMHGFPPFCTLIDGY